MPRGKGRGLGLFTGAAALGPLPLEGLGWHPLRQEHVPLEGLELHQRRRGLVCWQLVYWLAAACLTRNGLRAIAAAPLLEGWRPYQLRQRCLNRLKAV